MKRLPLHMYLVVLAVVLIVVAVLLMVFTPSAQAQPNTGTLEIVVRDARATPTPGVNVSVWHDTDDGTPTLIATKSTDGTGTVVYDDVRWGTYVVQFAGAVNGRPILAPENQNAGIRVDTGQTKAGFGVRFAEAHSTQLFVLAGTEAAEGAQLVPMFDIADSAADPPRPFNPVAAQEETARDALRLGAMQQTVTPRATAVVTEAQAIRDEGGVSGVVWATIFLNVVTWLCAAFWYRRWKQTQRRMRRRP